MPKTAAKKPAAKAIARCFVGGTASLVGARAILDQPLDLSGFKFSKGVKAELAKASFAAGVAAFGPVGTKKVGTKKVRKQGRHGARTREREKTDGSFNMALTAPPHLYGPAGGTCPSIRARRSALFRCWPSARRHVSACSATIAVTHLRRARRLHRGGAGRSDRRRGTRCSAAAGLRALGGGGGRGGGARRRRRAAASSFAVLSSALSRAISASSAAAAAAGGSSAAPGSAALGGDFAFFFCFAFGLPPPQLDAIVFDSKVRVLPPRVASRPGPSFR